MWRLPVMSCLVLLSASYAAGESREAEATRQVMAILNDPSYEAAVRPSADGGATTVKVQTYIREIDVNDQIMNADFDITFRMIWNDPRLAYQASGVEYVNILQAKLAWLPDAFFKNAITTQLTSVYPEWYLRVFPDGKIIYSTRLHIKQNCPMDFSRFPHDVQHCKLQIASYGFTTEEVVFTVGEDAVQVSGNLVTEKFNIENLDEDIFDYCNTKTATGEYSCIQVSFKMRRAFGTYMIEWYVPTMFLVVVAWFCFLIPKDMFLARLLLTLLPLITLANFSYTFRQSLASVPYIKALDVFAGISLLIIFGTLVYVIVCAAAEHSKGEAVVSVDPEEAGKESEVKSGGEMRKLVKEVKEKADFLSRILLIGIYVFFLFVYFVAYCGTG